MEHLSKKELITICEDLGLTQYKSKNKGGLIESIRKNNEPIISSETQPKHLKPLVKWSGGKGDEIKLFEKYFPENYDKYIEPFIGGGSVYFYLNPNNAVISDVHKELIDLYKTIGNGKGQDIYNFMEISPNEEVTIEIIDSTPRTIKQLKIIYSEK